MLRKSFNATAAAAAIALSLTACGGGGGTSALPSTGAPTNTDPTQGQVANASMSIKVPARPVSSSAKSAQYISASTQSITIGIVNNGKTTQVAEADLTPSSKGCSALSGGGLQCNVVFVGAAGSNIYALNMYDQTGGKGNLLSTGHVSATLVAGQNTNMPVALDGVPATVTAALSASTLQVGTAGSAVLVVEARDKDNNVIVGPGGFSSPITLAITGDMYHTLTLATIPSGSASPPPGPATVVSPGQLVTLNYNGGTNVGSTITPSIGGKQGTASTFAGSGAAMTMVAANLSNPPICCFSQPYPMSIAAMPDGQSAAVLLAAQGSCCPPQYAPAIAVADLNSVKSVFVGDTSDPYNPGTATSPYHGLSNVTVVHGMSVNLTVPAPPWGGGHGSFHTIETSTNGEVFYSASFSSTSAPSCSGQTLNSGVLGILNQASATTTEKVLKGVPSFMYKDGTGNLWFVESSGTCNGTNLLASGWAVGEYSASGALTEKDFGAIGIATSAVPTAMSVSPDGKQLYIADSNNNQILKISASALSAPTAVATSQSSVPFALVTGQDQTTMWFGEQGVGSTFYYGYVPGAQPFTQGHVTEAPMGVSWLQVFDAAYAADGSYWLASGDAYGIGRMTVGSSGPTLSFYPSAMEQEPASVSAAGGYVWGADYDEGTIMAIQYGAAPTRSTSSFNRIRNADAAISGKRNANAHHHG